MTDGSPVHTEFMIEEAYSLLCLTSMVLALRYSSDVVFQREICSTQRLGYSSSGMPNFSMMSSRPSLMK